MRVFSTISEAVSYASDCWVEVEFQLTSMNGWETDLDMRSVDDEDEDFSEMIGLYTDFIDQMRIMKEAGEEVLRGLEAAQAMLEDDEEED